MSRNAYYLFLLLAFSGLISCADDTQVGSGLLGDEDLEIIFDDDFDLTMRQLAPEPILMGVSNFQSLGTLSSTVFGDMSSGFYVRPVLNSFSARPDFGFSTYDSALLIFKIDTSRFFGNPSAFHDIEVFELTEQFSDVDSIFSDDVFGLSPTTVGSVDRLIPSAVDSITVVDQQLDSVSFTDVLTVKLDRRVGGRIFLDTVNNQTPEGIESLTNGFFVQSTSNNTLLQVNLNDQASSLMFYYKDSSGISRNFPYAFSNVRPQQFIYDLSGSAVQGILDGDDNNDLMYLQGHAGTTVEIDISDVNKLDDPFINYATLEIYAQTDGIIDTTFFPFPEALNLSKIDEDGQLVPVVDLELGLSQGQTAGIFDGIPEIDRSQGVVKYEMNITIYVKEVLKGREPSKIYLTVRNRVQNPNNLVFYGPNHPTFPAKLKLTYTKS